MKRLALLAALLSLSACSALQGVVCTLDKAATAQNAVNVNAIVALNRSYLAADKTSAQSLKDAQEAQNAAAVDLATQLAGAK